MTDKTKHRGDHYLDEKRECGTYVVRLWADEHDGSITWVDFEVHEIVASTSGNPLYPRRGTDVGLNDFVPSLDDSEPVAEGFAKWDGCTQFDVGSVHVDHKSQLEALFDAISKARRLAADLTGSDLRDEYA